MKEITDQRPPDPSNKKRNRAVFIACLVFLLLGIGWLLYYLIWGRFEEYTDDAYVNGNQVEVTSQVSGIVTKIHVFNTLFVEKNQLLLELDTTDASLFFEQKKTQLAQTLRQVVQLFVNVKERQAEIEMREAELFKKKLDFEHRLHLVESGGVSEEDFEHAEADFKSSYAALILSKHRLRAAYAEVKNTTVITHPLVDQAIAVLIDAWVRLQRCNIAAPVTGLIAQKMVQVGQWVNPTDPLLAIIPFDQMWVDANFKETQLTNARIGQPVEMVSDIYGSKMKYTGKVIGISGGTGSVFSVLPPQNATGNWIKIVQRLPVRISLDPEQIKQYPLRLGLSMDVTVDIRDTSGLLIPHASPLPVLYQTDLFAHQTDGVDEIIEEIIESNVDPAFLEPITSDVWQINP